MKRNRILLMVTVMALAFALAAFAQAGRMGGQRGAGQGQGQQGVGQPGAGFGTPLWLANYLGLSEEQVAQWQAIRDAAQASAASLLEQRKANFEQLQALLAAETKDPLAIGNLVIANHALRAQLQTIHETAEAQFILLLTPEQKTKFEQWLELRKSMPRRGHGGQGEGGFGMGYGGGTGSGFGPGDGSCPCCED